MQSEFRGGRRREKVGHGGWWRGASFSKPRILHCQNARPGLTCEPVPPVPCHLKIVRLLILTLALAATGAAHGARPTVSGKLAVLKRGLCYAPSKAPKEVREAIWAVNELRHKPYRWGGGHGTFDDVGYDCSGTVSYFLHAAGLLDQPTTSSALQTWGEPGRGRWITIYARAGHTFAVICGMRLDTTGRHGDTGPRWRNWPRKTGAFVARHPEDF